MVVNLFSYSKLVNARQVKKKITVKHEMINISHAELQRTSIKTNGRQLAQYNLKLIVWAKFEKFNFKFQTLALNII